MNHQTPLLLSNFDGFMLKVMFYTTYVLGACVSPHQVQGLEGHLHLPVGHPQCGGDGSHLHQGGHPSSWTSKVTLLNQSVKKSPIINQLFYHLSYWPFIATCIDTSTLFIFDNMESPLPWYLFRVQGERMVFDQISKGAFEPNNLFTAWVSGKIRLSRNSLFNWIQF